MRIGQRFFGLAQLASQPRCFIYFISFFHANYFTISATAILPNPPHHGVRALDVVFTLHGTSTPLACFHLPYQLHFETFAVTNHVHDTSVLSFQSTNLFQDGTTNPKCQMPNAKKTPNPKLQRELATLYWDLNFRILLKFGI